MTELRVEPINTRKKMGLGSSSLLLIIVGVLFSSTFKKHGSVGDNILRFIGVNPWSNGDEGIHYTVYYAAVFYILAFIVGYKFKNDWGAKTGKILSIIMIALVLFSTLFIIV
ncbi:hypothetical protein [Lederbergia citrea]|uniref:hypothetical protein n=1 Tax=Lederbergia citrea TaxID=2833581 RepID=UPI001BC98904|nr:hypothetical protein [Lederbergia citrea]MBS4203526.1 hypothetical protein [Lederbergia citrea]